MLDVNELLKNLHFLKHTAIKSGYYAKALEKSFYSGRATALDDVIKIIENNQQGGKPL